MEKNLALVLGGGGAAGNAWEIGVVAGLAQSGVDLTSRADVIIGTSAGATAAAQLVSDLPVGQLMSQILDSAAPSGRRPGAVATAGERPASLSWSEVKDRLRRLGTEADSAEALQRSMGEFALEADAFLQAGAQARLEEVAARLPGKDWPTKPLRIVTLRASDGSLAPLDRDSGATLVEAVAASTSMPGLSPTVEIRGVRYFDGGIRSAENATLAKGYRRVVILSPLGAHRRDLSPEEADAQGRFEGLRRDPVWGTDLPSEVAALQASGSHVELIMPDRESTEAMGPDIANPAVRIPVARAGFAQGSRLAARLRLN